MTLSRIGIIVLSLSTIVIAPIAGLALLPPPAPKTQNVGEYYVIGLKLDSGVFDQRDTTTIEYLSRGIHDVTSIVKNILRLKDSNPNTIALINDSHFSNGTIDVDIYSEIQDQAPGFARGFVGIAFRVSEDTNQYELVYLRPANGRAEDKNRRNHALQYAAHPDFHFDVSRRESPGKYEAAADIGLKEWINLRIEVEDENAAIYVDGKLLLEIEDLKLGPTQTGGIALWAGVGSKAHFSNLSVSHKG